MDNEAVTKEEIALELALKYLDKNIPLNSDYSPEGVGIMLAALYNTIRENLKD